MPDYRAFVPAQRLQQTIALSADGTTVAYASDASGQFNLWTRAVAGGPARQLTSFTDQAVRDVAWAPDGTRIAFTADTCGNEQTQVYLVPAGGGEEPVRLSGSADRQYRLAEKTAFDPAGRYLLCSGNDRDPAVHGLIIYDLSGGPEIRFPGVPGHTAYPVAISPDGRWALAGTYGANTDLQCYLADMTQPGTPLQAVTAHLPGSYYRPGPWEASGTGFLVLTTDGDGDHVCLARFSLPDKTLTIVDSPGWNVEQVTVSADGRTIAWIINEDGNSVLRAQRDGTAAPVPPIPAGVIAGAVEPFAVSADGASAAVLLDTPVRPLEVAIVDLASGQPLSYLTDTRPPALKACEPVMPELCHYPAADGASIPALLYRPAGSGPHPVVVSIHGGPETQARPAYVALHQYLLSRGIAVFAPNFRGSSGYGIAWQTRIYKDWGGIDLSDFAAAAEYLHTLDWVAADRLAVMGKSYGGFAALSCLSRLPHLWAAGVSICGPSNLETLARSMPPSWATTVATMIGDPDKDADRLRERSPVTYASQITAPLLVLQGATDPRVPQAESDQIVSRVRANGVDVQYLVFDDEGHGFTSRENDTRANLTIAEFLAEHLLR
jgi:dipeptidyl aminopeptidase/acylaminoacyl peptidase